MAADSFSKAYPMKPGNDLYSYSNNSTFQKGAIDAVKELINEEISSRLDTTNFSLTNPIRVADMGCSVGPNTFTSVHNIIEAVQRNYKLRELDSGFLEFQVFLNDHASNDFNTLFTSLPPDRKYYVVGVPGSFHGSLFPNSCLHIVHSSYALQWLSQVPNAVVDRSSPCWNKGRIFYSSEGDDEISMAFSDQFSKDMDCFLHFRAQEVVAGGLMIIVVPGRMNEFPHSRVGSNIAYNLLGSCLVDMVEKGIISEEKVESLNIPIYFPSPEEVEAAVERNGSFSIERIECLVEKERQEFESNHRAKARTISSHMRAGMGVLLDNHFGNEIMDELFDLYTKKLENPLVFESGKAFTLLAVLKRK